MKKTLTIAGHNEVITDKNYLGAGGEAAVYTSANGLLVYKLYHDPQKAVAILNKIAELKAIQSKDVLIPRDVIYEGGSPVGYSMDFLSKTDPLCKFFTKAFKNSQKITPDQIKELITNIQKIVPHIHKARCLIVDFNELNVLVEADRITPHIIDTDSFQTPNYPATAIMPSIRDPKATKFTELSDWFSWGILAFQAYINIHPYKGNHPDYTAMDWPRRMQDNVSVFDKKVTLPPVCNPLSVIPKNHLHWFEAVFQKGDRSVPPLADAVAIPVPQAIQIVKSSGKFIVAPVQQYDSKIRFHITYGGANWVATQTAIYKPRNIGATVSNTGRTRLVPTHDGELVVVEVSGDYIAFKDAAMHEFGHTTSNGGRCFVKNNALYTTIAGKLIETTFITMGKKIIPRTVDLDNVSEISSRMCEGIIVQDLLGEIFITVPYVVGRSKTTKLPEVKGYRVLEARSERNVVVLVTEKGGEYWRFVLTFDNTWGAHTFRLTKMQQYGSINMTVKPNGVGILVSDLDEIEVFKEDKVVVYKNPPFDESMWLFNVNDNVCFISGNQIYQVKIT